MVLHEPGGLRPSSTPTTRKISSRNRSGVCGRLNYRNHVGRLEESSVSRFKIPLLLEGVLLGLISTLGGALVGVIGSVALNSMSVPLPLGVQFVLLSDKLVVLPTAQVSSQATLSAHSTERSCAPRTTSSSIWRCSVQESAFQLD
jgi:hypothetical protein